MARPSLLIFLLGLSLLLQGSSASARALPAPATGTEPPLTEGNTQDPVHPMTSESKVTPTMAAELESTEKSPWPPTEPEYGTAPPPPTQYSTAQPPTGNYELPPTEPEYRTAQPPPTEPEYGIAPPTEPQYGTAPPPGTDPG